MSADEPCDCEYHRLKREVDMLTAQNLELHHALAWSSGASDFQVGGAARQGFEKVVKPALAQPMAPGALALADIVTEAREVMRQLHVNGREAVNFDRLHDAFRRYNEAGGR